MRNIVLDTNCLIACLSKKGKYHSVWISFLNGEYNLCISTDIIYEYEEIIARKTSPEFAEMVLFVILNSENTIRVNPNFRFGLITSDYDDNKFVDCAIIANAEYLVSEDRHYNILKTIDFPKVNIISLRDFCAII
ncbi:MAG: putative toxin-antitoxin system toxin component, PIN family [Dysgonamonadaceae bacterium]|jgi:putative PIN family toxin of toxin-antitoxin system|nr:putative toxin-antitoxin system toxin component, PIN family [Dysgonamonadaceae bacterium]